MSGAPDWAEATDGAGVVGLVEPTADGAVGGLHLADVSTVEFGPAHPVTGRIGSGAAAFRSPATVLDAVDPLQLRAVHDVLLDPCLILRAVRQGDGTIVDFRCEEANEAAAQSLDVGLDDLIGRLLTDAMAEDLARLLLDWCIGAVATGEPLTFDDLPIVDDATGETDHFDVRGMAVGDRVCFTWRDVTERIRGERELAESRNRYRLLAEHSSDVVIMVERDGTLGWVSPSAREVLGWDPGGMVGRRWDAHVVPEDIDGLRTARASAASTNAPSGEVRCIRGGGDPLWMSVRISEIHGDAGELAGHVASLRDVHEQVLARHELVATLKSHQTLSTAIEQAAESVVVTEVGGTIAYANPATAKTTGYPLEEIVGADPTMFASGIHDAAFFADIVETLMGGDTWRGQIVSRNRNGELYEEESTITPVTDASGSITSFVSVLRNISRERRLEADLDRLRTDRESVTRAMSGVRVGSSVEATASSFCRAVTRLDDVSLARLVLVDSDDSLVPLAVPGRAHLEWEVGVPLTFSSLPQILARTRKGAWWAPLADLIAAGAEPDGIAGTLLAHGFESAGAAPIWWEHQMVGLLIVAGPPAEDDQGYGSRVSMLDELGSFAGSVIGAQAGRRAEWRRQRGDVQTIIDSGAFHPVYQPVIDIGTGAVQGHEALTRFDSGTRPDLVFESAHAVGLGVELESACARVAVEGAVALPGDGWIAVNFSPRAIICGAMTDVVPRADRPVVIEITEHVEVESYTAIRDAVEACPGVRVSVDDAGAGYASLRHILELQPDFVKLDIGLVRDIDSDPARQALAAGLRHYAHETGNILIAEGVETPGEHAALRRLGIPLGQGYLFGRPAVAESDSTPA